MSLMSKIWRKKKRRAGSESWPAPPRFTIQSSKFSVDRLASASAASSAAAGGRGDRKGRWHVVPIQDRVEHHVELAEVLPAIDRVVGEHDDAAFVVIRLRDVDDEGFGADGVGPDHHAAEY